MDYKRMPIEIEAPEQMGYSNIKYNLTESSVTDQVLDGNFDLKNILLSYSDHIGKPELRKLIASETRFLGQDNVLLTPSAATALFIIHTTLLEKGSHLIVVRPNYATNIETPKAIGCQIDYIDVKFENGFKTDWDKLESMIRPDTKLISLTHPHNPTGVCMNKEDFVRLNKIAVQHNAHILVDETYRELNRIELFPYAADLNRKIISVSSMSKAYGLPGIRIGWILSQDRLLLEKFLAAKEQIIICNSIVDEEIAFQCYKNKRSLLKQIEKTSLENFNIVKKWMSDQSHLEWVEPSGGVVCFPRIKEELKLDYKKFYRDLNETFGTYVGPGHWFDQAANYFRVGFGYPLKEELQTGLENITNAINLQLKASSLKP
ncbi:MAG: aminotransferase class I/II-fold pyridoxal phosphate-dependent enzyme [Cyclobacteriaceae bacterium]